MSTTNGNWRSNFAVVTSVVSLGVACFGTVFTVLRARSDDQSRLRTELTETLGRVIPLTYGDSDTVEAKDELAAGLGQLREIVKGLDDVSAVSYHQIAAGLTAGGRYEDALEIAELAVKSAQREGDAITERAVQRLRGNIFNFTADYEHMRSAYDLATRMPETEPFGMNVGVTEMVVYNLTLWAREEASLRRCDAASDLVTRAKDIAREAGEAQRPHLVSLARSRDEAVRNCRA